MIKPNAKYKINHASLYFKRKYGDPSPIITIEGNTKKVFTKDWRWMDGNPACMLYAMRMVAERLSDKGEVYYGKIEGLGELVHESELEEIKE